MAKSPTTSSQGNPPLGRDVLVATKFHVPRAGFVPRPRLLARLSQGIGSGLTVVCTPAGFGKTTMLGDWARRSRVPAAWLSLDAGDNDPARFWRYVAAALDRVRPGTDAPVTALLRGRQQPPLEAVATVVINELSVPGEGGVALVLDDYHLVEAPPVHDSVTFLRSRWPRSRNGRRGGRRGCSWPRWRCGGMLIRLGSSRRSPAAIAMCWIT